MDKTAFELPPRRRHRRPVKKSTLGCAKCKTRKVKCDETKPSCLRCCERGWKCPGVATGPKIRWSTKHEKYEAKEGPSAQEMHDLLSECEKNPGSFLSPPHSESDLPPLPPPDGERECGHENSTGDDVNELHTTDLRNGDDESLDMPDLSDVTHLLEDGTRPDGLLASLFSPPWFPLCELSDASMVNEEFQEETSLMTYQSHALKRSEPLSTGLFDVQSELVKAYFEIVCPIFSTFDSEENLFRSFVSDNWQNSISMFYAILSMAAGKLARQQPEMKVQALEYQSIALSNLYTDVASAAGWTKELLFVILMLGLSTSWHDMTDLGIPHLKAMQSAILEKTVRKACDSRSLKFFGNALVYWEMVVCCVNDEVSIQEYPGDATTESSSCITRIMPHPWTGVASAPQALLARLAHHIRQVRPFNTGGGLNCPDNFLRLLDGLEEEIWGLELPQLHEIANTGDPNTPAIHHLLLAEAYMFANLYQLYYAFPNRRQRRARRITEQAHSGILGLGHSWTGQQARSWASLLEKGSTKEWVDFLGRNVIMRLEQIQITSGTACVHPLLLLVGSGSLSVTPEQEERGEASDIHRTREFVLDRLSRISDSKLSEPVNRVKEVVLEVFKRLDLGVDVFWMDILHSMGAITVIG